MRAGGPTGSGFRKGGEGWHVPQSPSTAGRTPLGWAGLGGSRGFSPGGGSANAWEMWLVTGTSLLFAVEVTIRELSVQTRELDFSLGSATWQLCDPGQVT